jgi:hypothetical protein
MVRSRRKLDDFALAQLDFQLRDLGAERRPGERGVHADDVAAGAMRDGLQQIAPSAVHERQADEGAPEVVAASLAKLQRVQVEPERFGSFLA